MLAVPIASYTSKFVQTSYILQHGQNSTFSNTGVNLIKLVKGLVKKYRWGWAGAERGWVMRF